MTVVDQQRTDAVRGRQQPLHRELPFDDEDRVPSLDSPSTGRVIEIAVVVKSGVCRVVHTDERTLGGAGLWDVELRAYGRRRPHECPVALTQHETSSPR